LFERVISINGAPRSGTSWLGQIFNSNEDVKYKFQPFYSYLFRNSISLNATFEQMHRFFTELYNYNDWYLDQIKQIKSGLVPKFEIKNEYPSTLVFKNVRKHYILSKMLEVYENLKVVCIIRNPVDAMNSWYLSPSNFLREWDFEGEWEYAQSRNQFMPDEYYGFHKWKECNMLFLHLAEKYPHKVKVVKYKDLTENCLDVVSQIFIFCSLSVGEQTKKFIGKSQTVDIDNEYSVYKNRKSEIVLPQFIIDKIKLDLKGSILEQFV